MENLNANLPYYIWKTSSILYQCKIPLVPFIIQQFLRFIFCCYLPYSTNIGKNVHFAHLGMGIVIDKHCIIGDNVQINQHVTIGGRNNTGFPVIGNNVHIGDGAKIIGGVKIGNNSKIGANAVVLTDVPDNATAVGVPARIINH